MNRTLALLLALVMVLGMLPAQVQAEEAMSGIRWTIDNGVLTFSGTGTMKPEGEPFPDNWPSGEGITAIVVEEGITDVSNFAFEDFTELTTVTLADSVQTVGYAAFEDCAALTLVTMPYGIHVNMDAFNGTPWLESLPRDEKGFAIHKGILMHYDGEETDIEIPDTVVSVAGGFTDVELCSVVLPDSVTILGDYAFYLRDTLERVEFSDNLRYLGDWAFESTGLTEAILPESLQYLGDGAFAWCDELTKVSIPDELEYLGNSLFNECEALVDVTLGEGIDGIPRDMFRNCESLTAVDIPSTVTYIGETAFARCYALKEIVIPEGVTSIDYQAFWDCWNMTSVVLPESIKNITSTAFDGCSSLTQMNLPDGLETFGVDGMEYAPWLQNRYDDNGYAVEGQWLLSYRGSDTFVVIPESVKRIAGRALDACSDKRRITSLTLPDGLEYIGSSAFSGCTGLTELTLPDTVTYIDEAAFYSCTGLRSLVIPDSVTGMNYSAFAYCENLSELTLSANLTEIPEYCFEGCESLQTVEIPDGVTTICYRAFYGCTGMESITIPASVTTIEDRAVGYYTETYYYETVPMRGFTIYGYPDTAAQTYAWVNGFKFVDLSKPAVHNHVYYPAEVIEPTCTEGGYTFYACECGVGYIDDYTDPLGHDWGDWVAAVDPTCTESGYVERCCSRCGEIEGLETEPLGHDYSAVITAPTCTDQGYTTYTCHCGDSYVADFVEALGHEWDEGVVTVEPTEDAEGEMTYTCQHCSETRIEVLPKLDHVHDYSAVITAPTCTDQGFTTYTCACGDTYVSDYVDALGHDYADGTCTRCGEADPDYEESAENPFTDVPEDSFYYEPVIWAVSKGITNGTSATTFGPGDSCMRAHVVTFLWRAAGSPEPVSSNNPFTDVKETDFYFKAVLWAVENGITNGLDATHFGPFAYCNRAQVVTFLHRTLHSPAPSTSENPFTDVPAGQWYTAPVLWAVENGITNGLSPTTFGPTSICNRAQIVTFLYRAFN